MDAYSSLESCFSTDANPQNICQCFSQYESALGSCPEAQRVSFVLSSPSFLPSFPPIFPPFSTTSSLLSLNHRHPHSDSSVAQRPTASLQEISPLPRTSAPEEAGRRQLVPFLTTGTGSSSASSSSRALSAPSSSIERPLPLVPLRQSEQEAETNSLLPARNQWCQIEARWRWKVLMVNRGCKLINRW